MESENILLRRFAENGDAEALSEVVHRHAGLVYGACLRVLEDKNKAADAVQETFFQLVRQAGQITGSVPTWLHRVATRKAIDVLRRDSARRRRETSYAAGKLRETENWGDVSVHVDEAMDELDDELREILIQRFFEGRTTTEIADKSGISQPTVSRRIESGVAKLRVKLHNRGIIVPVAALASLLGQNAVEAAPAIVLKELGKIALAGAPAATASGAAATAASAGAKATVGAVAAGVKAKIVTVAVIAAVGVGGVVTYNHVSETGGQSGGGVTEPAPKYESRSGTYAVGGMKAGSNADTATGEPVGRAGFGQPATSEELATEDIASEPAPAAETPRSFGGGQRGFGGYGGRYGGGGYGGTAVQRGELPDDANSAEESRPRGRVGGFRGRGEARPEDDSPEDRP